MEKRLGVTKKQFDFVWTIKKLKKGRCDNMANYEKKMTICLDTIDKVKGFVNDIKDYRGDLDLMSGKYVVDAKSIMGVFCLDLTKPLTLKISSDFVEDYGVLEKYVQKD